MLTSKRKIYQLAGAGIAAIVLVAAIVWIYLNFNQPFKAVYSLDNLKINSPIAVSFNRPIQDHVNYNI